jgi:hypothetical protein
VFVYADGVPLAHPTKTKGDLAVAHAYTDLMDQGYLVLWPSTEHAPFDLVAYRDGQFLRVQVKYRQARSDGAVTVEFKTGWSDRHGYHPLPMDKTEVDILCVYCPMTNDCYYVRPQDHGGHVTIRIRPSRNNQSKGVHVAEQCRRVPEPVQLSLGQ